MTDKKNAVVPRPAMTREEFEAKFAEFYAELARRAEPYYPVILVDRAGIATIEEPRGPWARAWRRRLDERGR